MAAMTALFGFAGIMLGGFEGLLIAIILAIMMNLFAWYNSDKMVLRMYGAKKVPQEHPLYEMVANLSYPFSTIAQASSYMYFHTRTPSTTTTRVG